MRPERVMAALVALSALAVWPWAERPFSSPKLAVLAAAVALLAWRMPKKPFIPRVSAWGLGAWAAGLAVSVFVNGGAWDVVLRESLAIALVALAIAEPPDLRTFRALAATAALVSVVAILQHFGADPFAWLGFHRALPGERLRVYATLGNPDFVAAWLLPACFLLLPWRSPWRPAGLLFAAAALLVCRSHATWVAAIAGVFAWAVAERARPPLAAIGLVVLLVVFAPWSRPLASRIEGRGSLARIALSHVANRPVVGHGPGSFALSYPGWKPEEIPLDTLQDHVHDDWLEKALEEGVPAALGFLVLVAGGLVAAVRSRRGWLAAALASLAVRACVDFPFARVPEIVLLAVFLGLAYNSEDGVEAWTR